MAAAVGKKSTTSLSLFLFIEAFGIEVEEQLSTMATQAWAGGAMDRKMVHRTKRTVDESDFRSDVETSERACRSGDVFDSRPGHQVATVPHLDF